VTPGRQLAFDFPHAHEYEPAALLCGTANAQALRWLEAPAGWPGLRLAIHGAPGTGKTHILHLFAARQRAILLPGGSVRGLIALPPRGAVAIDDADTAPEPEALLHLLNAAAEQGRPLLLAGRKPPARWPTDLPDLASRLRAITPAGLGQPDDGLLRALLARLIAERQLRVEAPVQAYLLARLPRSCAALREAAARLDRLSLAAGKRVSRRMASVMLAELLAETGTEFFQNEEIAPVPSPPSPDAARLL